EQPRPEVRARPTKTVPRTGFTTLPPRTGAQPRRRTNLTMANLLGQRQAQKVYKALPDNLLPALDRAKGLLQPLSGIDVWRGRGAQGSWQGYGLGHSEVLIPGNRTERRPTIRLVYDNLTNLRAPVHMITDAANTNLIEQGGVAGAIWNAGGPRMQAWLRTRSGQGYVAPGQGISSPAFNIRNTRYVAHMVGPDFNQEAQQSAQLMYDTYVNLPG